MRITKKLELALIASYIFSNILQQSECQEDEDYQPSQYNQYNQDSFLDDAAEQEDGDPCTPDPCSDPEQKTEGECKAKDDTEFECDCKKSYQNPIDRCRTCEGTSYYGKKCEYSCDRCNRNAVTKLVELTKTSSYCHFKRGCKECREGFRSKWCGRLDCDRNPCRNHGQCTKKGCICTEEWTGDTCEISIYRGDAPLCPETSDLVVNKQCENGGVCRVVEGVEECVCPVAWQGEYCTLSCKENSPNCVKGQCVQEKNFRYPTCKCQPGWGDPFCNLPCEPGSYGSGCEFDCGNCKDDEPCDIRTGACQACEEPNKNQLPNCLPKGKKPTKGKLKKKKQKEEKEEDDEDEDNKKKKKKKKDNTYIVDGNAILGGKNLSHLSPAERQQIMSQMQQWLQIGLAAGNLWGPAQGAQPGRAPGGRPAGGFGGPGGFANPGGPGAGFGGGFNGMATQLRPGSVVVDYQMQFEPEIIDSHPDFSEELTKSLKDNSDQLSGLPEGMELDKESIKVNPPVKTSRYFGLEQQFNDRLALVIGIGFFVVGILILSAIAITFLTQETKKNKKTRKKSKKARRKRKKKKAKRKKSRRRHSSSSSSSSSSS